MESLTKVTWEEMVEYIEYRKADKQGKPLSPAKREEMLIQFERMKQNYELAQQNVAQAIDAVKDILERGDGLNDTAMLLSEKIIKLCYDTAALIVKEDITEERIEFSKRIRLAVLDELKSDFSTKQ